MVLENTHNLGGGTVQRVDEVQAVVAAARECGFRVHVDGARIWNAAVALGVPPAALVKGVDTVMACLSKGLCAPVGSILAASRERDRGGAAGAQAARRRDAPGRRSRGRRARRPRHPGPAPRRGPRERAAPRRRRSAGERACGSLPVETNIVVATLEGRTAPDVVAALREAGVLAIAMDARTLRARDAPRRLARGLRAGGGRDRAGPRLSAPRAPARRSSPLQPAVLAALAAGALVVLSAAPAATQPVLRCRRPCRPRGRRR